MVEQCEEAILRDRIAELESESYGLTYLINDLNRTVSILSNENLRLKCSRCAQLSPLLDKCLEAAMAMMQHHRSLSKGDDRPEQKADKWLQVYNDIKDYKDNLL